MLSLTSSYVCFTLYGYPRMFLVGLTHVGIESATLQWIAPNDLHNIDHPHRQHLHEVIIDKTQV